jgi:hypothetical protein
MATTHRSWAAAASAGEANLRLARHLASYHDQLVHLVDARDWARVAELALVLAEGARGAGDRSLLGAASQLSEAVRRGAADQHVKRCLLRVIEAIRSHRRPDPRA